MGNRWGNSVNSVRLYFFGSKITTDGDCSHEIKRRLLLGRKFMTNLDSILKSRGITLPTKVHLVKAMVFLVVMYGCESWTIKKAECQIIDNFWTVVLKTFESPLDCKEIQSVHPKGNQSWIFIERTDAEAETPILWPPDVKNWHLRKDPDVGKDWRQEEKEMTEDKTWWTWVWICSRSWWWTGMPGVLQSMHLKELDMTEQLNWTELLAQTVKNLTTVWETWVWSLVGNCNPICCESAEPVSHI